MRFEPVRGGDLDAAQAQFERTLSMCQAAPHPLRAEGIALGRLGLVAQGRGDLASAREMHEAALAILRDGESALSAAIEANLGAVNSELGRNVQARAQLNAASQAARRLGAPVLAAHAAGTLGIIDHDEGLLDEAVRSYGMAIDDFEELGDIRYRGVFLVYRGGAWLERGETARARGDLADAIEALRAVDHDEYLALGLALLASAEADASDIPAAEAAHIESMSLLSRHVQPGIRHTIVLLRSFIELAAGRAAEASAAAARHLGEAEALFEAAVQAEQRAPSATLWIGIRRTHSALARHRLSAQLNASVDAIIADPDGAWFQLPTGERVDLDRRPVLRRALRTLVAQRISDPGQSLSTELLIRSVWPGERILRKAALNRLHVNIARLRKLGLGNMLLRDRNGYYLSADVPLRLGS